MRNVCTPFTGVRHLESATRGTSCPRPTSSPATGATSGGCRGATRTSRRTCRSRTASRRCGHRTSAPPRNGCRCRSGAQIKVFRSAERRGGGRPCSRACSASPTPTSRAVRAVPLVNRAPVRRRRRSTGSSPTSTARSTAASTRSLRLADHLRTHARRREPLRVLGRAQRGVLPLRDRRRVPRPGAARRSCSTTLSLRGGRRCCPRPTSSIATLWATAYSVAQFPAARRQVLHDPGLRADVLPGGHALRARGGELPTRPLRDLQHRAHAASSTSSATAGSGMSFQPAVDPTVFHAEGRRYERSLDEPATVFLYARPGHWRNCWELASIALEELKSAPRRPRPHRHRGVVGASRGPRERASSTSGCSTTARPATSTARATSASRSPCRSTRRTCRSS